MNRYEEINQTKETYRAQLAAPEEAWPPKVQQAVIFIIAHLFDPRLTIRWMKEQCRITGHNFSSRFAHYLDKTPKQYILYHRIKVAKELLRKTGLPIVSIAMELGFSGQAVFTNTFKRQTGETPASWKKKNADGNKSERGNDKKK